MRTAIDDKQLHIDPFNEKQLGPCSYDMMLGTSFAFFAPPPVVDPQAVTELWYRRVYLDETLLPSKAMVLGSTWEKIKLGDGLAARVEGKSSLGRLGLMVHITAGFIDAGFEGQVTLELCNLMDRPMRLTAGMPIAQLSVFELDQPCEHPYAGKYQHQKGATGSKYGQ